MARTRSYPIATLGEFMKWIRSQEVGSLKVLDVKTRLDEDASGQSALFFDLVLADPASGQETWPVDEVLELQRRIDDHAAEVGLEPPWHVTLLPESPGESPSDEDAADEL